MSSGYLWGLFGAFVIMGIYALLWQQVIKRIPIGEAYLFKGSGLLWTMLICFFFFDEPITVNNIIGIIIVCLGITLFARS